MGCNSSKPKGQQTPQNQAPPPGLMIQRKEPSTPRQTATASLEKRDEPQVPLSARNFREQERDTGLIRPNKDNFGEATKSFPAKQPPEEPEVPEKPADVARADTPKIAEEKAATQSKVSVEIAQVETEEERQRREVQKVKVFADPPKQKPNFPTATKYKFLNHIFVHLQNDDYVSIKNIFDEYEPIDLGFVVNQDENLMFDDGSEEGQSMVEWTLMQVALAIKAHRTVNYLLKCQRQMCIVPRADMSDIQSWPDTAPNYIYDVEELLTYELLPLRICVLKKDYKMLAKMWRLQNTWEACHFYRLVELFIEQDDALGLKKFVMPVDKYITHFFEPQVLQRIQDEKSQLSDSIVDVLSTLLESYQQRQGIDRAIESWAETYNLESSTAADWPDHVWNAVATDCNHDSYKATISAIKDLANQFNIETDVEGCAITPLHFLFAKYIAKDEMIPTLIDKCQKIDSNTTNLRKLFRLQEEAYDPRHIQADSFRDGGLLLLWCLKHSKPKVLMTLLNQSFIQFWRFSQLKTLLWACLQNPLTSTVILDTLMTSPVMHSVYVALPARDKVLLVSQAFDLAQQNDNIQHVQQLFAEVPYSTGFICQVATIEEFQSHQTTADFYNLFSRAVEKSTPYELEQMARVAYYEDILRFTNDLKIQDDSTIMYQSAMKLIDLCKLTNFMANIEDDATRLATEAQENNHFGMAPEANCIGEEVDLDVQPVASDIVFKIDEFKQALDRDQNEDIYHTLVQSNEQKNGNYKVPPQVLFMDWSDAHAYCYRSSSMQTFGLNADIVSDNLKGTISLAECNLVHRMLIKKFRLNTSIKFLLDSFTYQNCAKQEKPLPRNMLILNRNPDFDKGVSKILKTTTLALVEMMPADTEQIVQFIIQRFAVGSLTSRNILSFVSFLEKVSLAIAPVNIQVRCIFRMLSFQGFFKAHLASFTEAQVDLFNQKIAAIKAQSGGEAFDFLEPVSSQHLPSAEDAKLQLIQQITNMGNCYKTEKFLSLLRQVSGSQEGGWDSKIRFPMLGSQQLKPGQVEPSIGQNEVGPLLLAIDSLNSKAIADLLKNDKSMNLRESLRGPKDQQSGSLVDGCWVYTFTKKIREEKQKLTRTFRNLGMALLADCDKNNDNQARAILSALLLQPSFLPDACDFESFVTVCRERGTTILLKPFVQAGQMQLLFCSYPYEYQRRITRLLLGLLPDVQSSQFEDQAAAEDDQEEMPGEGQQSFSRKIEQRQFWHIFELDTITLRRPYIVFAFIEMMQYRWRGLQAIEAAKELLMHLTPAELELAFHVDQQLVEYVKNTEDWLRLESESEDSNLVANISRLITRIKKENPEAEFKMNQLARMTTKARAVRGSVAPHVVVEAHPAQKDILSELSVSDDEGEQGKAVPAEEPSPVMSD